MITTSSLAGITYNLQGNQLQLTDNVDTSKKGQFNLTQVPSSSLVVLNFPSVSGTIVTTGTSPGSIAFGNAQLNNSSVVVSNTNILSTSTIIACYNNINSVINVENTGSLFVDAINPGVSFTINSTKEGDNSSFYYIIIY